MSKSSLGPVKPSAPSNTPARMPTPNSVGIKTTAPKTPGKSGSGRKSGSK